MGFGIPPLGYVCLVLFVVWELGLVPAAVVVLLRTRSPCLLWCFAEHGHTDIVRCLVGLRMVDVDGVNNKGWTALHYTADNRDSNTMEVLIGAGADIDAKDNRGRSPLLWSCRSGSLEGVKLLVGGGARVRVTDEEGETCLTVAAAHGHTETVRYLVGLKEVEVDHANANGQTALCWANRKGHADVLQVLTASAQKAKDHRAAGKEWDDVDLARSTGSCRFCSSLCAVPDHIARRAAFCTKNECKAQAALEEKKEAEVRRQVHEQEEFPSHWDRQDANLMLVDVPLNTSEGHNVLKHFFSSMVGHAVQRVQRIQNQDLWRKFALAHRLLHAAGNATTSPMFHGTRGTSPDCIYNGQEGFDPRHCNGGLWGFAAYFAACARYSHSYSHQDTASGNKQMFLAKVLVGVTKEYGEEKHPSLRMPPLLPNGGNRCYDSVSGITGGSPVVMVYDNGRAYPEYLISYK